MRLCAYEFNVHIQIIPTASATSSSPSSPSSRCLNSQDKPEIVTRAASDEDEEEAAGEEGATATATGTATAAAAEEEIASFNWGPK